MNGKWKSDVSGWNHKDSRRKKQTRNSILKDRGLYFSRKEPKESVRLESEVEFIEDTIVKYGESKSIYKIKINKSYNGEHSFRKAWYYGSGSHKEWYDAITNQPIHGWGHQIEIVEELWQEYTHYQKPRVYSSGYRGLYTKSQMFLYDKPVQNWKRWTFYGDGKRRKYAQKYANSMDRNNLRTWITRGDWDLEMKTHALSKSVAWEVH